mmetsp:Transcript_8920/g.22286  ORF Transcript_8920/g.22286 Transcript_8920/m.22286 type:complete len:300 (-) Transcript_8920:145-1044(-)
MLSSLQELADAAMERIETARTGKALLDADFDGQRERFIRGKLDFCNALALDANIFDQIRSAVTNYEEVAERLRKLARTSGPAPEGVEPVDFGSLAEYCGERARRYRICLTLGDTPAAPPMTATERDMATILQVKDRAGLSHRAQADNIAQPTALEHPQKPNQLAVGEAPRLGLRGLRDARGMFACLDVEDDIKKAASYPEMHGTTSIVVEPQRLFMPAPGPRLDLDNDTSELSQRSANSRASTGTPTGAGRSARGDPPCGWRWDSTPTPKPPVPSGAPQSPSHASPAPVESLKTSPRFL